MPVQAAIRPTPTVPPASAPSRANAGLAHALERAARASAAVVTVGGCLVVLGWAMDVQRLRALGPVNVVMNPTVAVLFVLAGGLLLLGARPRPRAWVAACALTIALCGALVLARSVAGWNAGVDEWLFRDKVLRVTPPDHMAPNTALNFVLLGLALLVREVRGRRGWRPAHWLVLPVALTSLLVVVGYLYGAAGFISFELELPMALNTALFFLGACFALVGSHPDKGVIALFVSDSAGGAIMRRLLPALLLVPLVVGVLVNVGMGAGWYGATVGLSLLTLATLVLSILLTLTAARALHGSDLALRRSEEHFRALIENASDYVMIVDRGGAIQYASPSIERILGYRPDEVLGDTPDQLVHPHDLARVREALRQVFARPGEVIRTEFRIRHRDGGWRVFENVGRTLRDDSGEAGAIANARDITDRRRAEDETARQKAYFEGILDSLDAGVVVYDPAGRFEYVSAAAVPQPHIRRWAKGKTLEELGRATKLPAETVGARRECLDVAMKTRSPGHFEEDRARPDGTREQMLHRIVPIVNEAGELVRLVEICVDISERKAVEVALQEAKEEAERANQAKSEFLSRMSHELRTPMNAILGFAQLLERRELTPHDAKLLAHILRGGRHLLRLINEVLDLARIEAGGMELSLEPVAVNGIVREAMELVRPLSGGTGVGLSFEEGPEVFASADRQRLSQVLINLLSNAIKYNRAGGQVRIRADVSEQGVSIRVKDHGKGIPADRLGHLFTPFARLGAEQTETEGTGLGLALSQRLAEAMGGGLVLEETGPEGSTFRLDLRPAADPLQGPHLAARRVQVGPDSGAPAKILYIEDNLTNLSLVEAVLESRPSWNTLSALRAEAGIEMAREKQPDLILLDLHLPDLGGDEVLDRLRADPATASIPIVIISADATATSQARLRAAGANDYLTKPLDLDVFLSTVERYLPG
ncbi:MAG TPA: PAS domain S-box protein [Longimicrobium sp.]|jgi:PAS domain S-box-containing protein